MLFAETSLHVNVLTSFEYVSKKPGVVPIPSVCLKGSSIRGTIDRGIYFGSPRRMGFSVPHILEPGCGSLTLDSDLTVGHRGRGKDIRQRLPDHARLWVPIDEHLALRLFTLSYSVTDEAITVGASPVYRGS